MRSLLLHSLLLICFVLKAQDKVYFLDGRSKTGRVSEISSDYIILDADETESIPSSKVLLIEFKNGMVELINKPAENVIYNPASRESQQKAYDKKDLAGYNLISLNTLALCNADVTGFYERILPGKKFGMGVMGAYNFNQYANQQDVFISILNNAKKKYDLGLFANVYTGDMERGTSFHYGILFKYMSFNFTKVTEEQVTSGNVVSTNIKYSPASGSQLATLFTFGTHTGFAKNMFLKTLFGIGGFNMHGDYRQQYNYFLNKNNSNNSSQNTNTTTLDRKFLLKLYLGINIGFNF